MRYPEYPKEENVPTGTANVAAHMGRGSHVKSSVGRTPQHPHRSEPPVWRYPAVPTESVLFIWWPVLLFLGTPVVIAIGLAAWVWAGQ